MVDIGFLTGREEVPSAHAGPEGVEHSRYARYYDPQQSADFLASLPPSLELLKLAACTEAVFGFLDRLLPQAKEAPLPLRNLKSVTVSFRPEEATFGSLDWGWWVQRGANKGVVLTQQGSLSVPEIGFSYRRSDWSRNLRPLAPPAP